MIDFIKYFFRIKKINFLLTFLSLLNFGIMFGVEEDKKKHKIEIKFEKKDKVEKKPFIMFFENFCKTLNIEVNIEDFQKLKYDFEFFYKDSDGDKVIVFNNYYFNIFYNDKDLYEKKSTTRHLFFRKKEDDNNINKVYDDIIKNENFKNISITVYIDEAFETNNEEEKKEEDIKVNIGKNNHIEKNHIDNIFDVVDDDKNKNGNVNCPRCNCC